MLFYSFDSSQSFGNEVSLSYVTGLPDPNTINNSRLVVVFKNLLKKDSTTKDKALADFVSIISEEQGPSYIDSELHWAWVLLYPKLSIDSSRTVRALAHKVQGLICRILGKQSSKYLKESIGPWLAGLYDTDKSVVTAAEHAIDIVFPTQDKKDSLTKVFESTLLDYIYDVVACQSIQSLSDERYVAKDEAEAKYYRTVRAAIALFTQLLKNNPSGGPKFENILQNKKIWKFAYSSDVALSRTTLDLVYTMVSYTPQYTEENLKEVSTNVVNKGLKNGQVSVLTDLLQTIIVLTKAFPQCWGVGNSDKSVAVDELNAFIKQGSRRSGKYFWPSLLALLSSLPDTISPYSLKSTPGTSETAADAILEGILKEMVVHLGTGWGTYLSVIEKIVASDVSADISKSILNNAFNNVSNYLLLQEGETLDREILIITGKKLSDLWALDPDTMEKAFGTLLETIAVKRKSKAFFKKYLFTLKIMFDNLKDSKDKDKVLALLTNNLTRTLQALNSDDDEFKIYTMASILATFEENIFNYDSRLITDVGEFLINNLATFIVSDAAADVVQILKQYTLHNQQDDDTIQQCVELCFNSVVKLSDLDRRSSLFPLVLKEYSLFRGRTAPIPLASEYLLSVYSSIDSWEITNDWDSILFGISSHGTFVSEEVAFDILKGVSSLQLVQGKNVEKAIWTFSNLLKLDRPYFMKFIETDAGKVLVSHLWKLAEDFPEAEGILSAIEDNAITPSKDVDPGDMGSKNKTLDSLTDGLLSEIERSSVEGVDISVQRGQRLLDQTQEPTAKIQLFEKLLFYPSGEWSVKLNSLFKSGVSSSLAVSNPLGGALYFLEEDQLTYDERQNLQVIPDQLISMSIFSVCLIGNNKPLFEKLPQEVQIELIISLGLISEASTDHAFLAVTNDPGVDDNFLSEAIIAFSKDVCAILLDSLKGFTIFDAIEVIISGEPEGLPHKLIQFLWQNSIARDAKGYYSARVLSFMLDYLVNRPVISESDAEDLVTRLKNTKGFFDNNPLGVSAVLLGFQRFSLSLKVFSHLRNQFASDLIGDDVLPGSFKSLVYLNSLFNASVEEFQERQIEPFPINRLVMCLKSLFKSAESEVGYTPEFLPVRIEITKLLSKLLPLYPSVPAGIWESAVELLEQDFVTLESSSISIEYFTLKFFNVLVKYQENIADLSEVWMDKQGALYTELLEVLFRAKASINRARELTNVQLLKAVSTTPLKLVDEPENLYSLLAVPSFEIQRAGYIILHQLIPLQQEERSIELQLHNTKLTNQGDEREVDSADQRFNLPVELVSLLLETPVRGAPAYDVTRYLWSWMLIYDHFGKATYDLRKVYIDELKGTGHLETFLNFISERIVFGELENVFLLDKEKPASDIVRNCDDMVYESIDDEINVLIIHLYYLALQFTGSLVKAWFLGLKKRQITIALEKFTESYISPTIVEDELDSVENMLKKNNDQLIDNTMDAKVNRPVKEVHAYYTIDGQTMEIAIKMPSLYPLKDITIEGVKRIGVKEKQWRAWLLASQAIGTSQNGTIIDTLELFKRNVSLHFQGVTECAICYSILHQDHSLPTKTCTTCKNKFHANCLYKWFKSASSNTCPLCRTNFSFRIGL